MPIDPETFDEGETTDSVESRILDLLYENPNRAYNVREIAVEVMSEGVSERNVDRPSDEQEFMALFLDIATVATVLERLCDDKKVVRRLVDTGEGLRSYYRAPSTVDSRLEA